MLNPGYRWGGAGQARGGGSPAAGAQGPGSRGGGRQHLGAGSGSAATGPMNMSVLTLQEYEFEKQFNEHAAIQWMQENWWVPPPGPAARPDRGRAEPIRVRGLRPAGAVRLGSAPPCTGLQALPPGLPARPGGVHPAGLHKAGASRRGRGAVRGPSPTAAPSRRAPAGPAAQSRTRAPALPSASLASSPARPCRSLRCSLVQTSCAFARAPRGSPLPSPSPPPARIKLHLQPCDY